MDIKDLARSYSNDWDHVKISIVGQFIKFDSYSESKVDGLRATYRFDGTLVEDTSSTPVPVSMLVDDFIKEGKSFVDALIAVYDAEVEHLTAIDEKEKAEAASRAGEQITVDCPKCSSDITIPADLDLTKIAIDCPICNRIIECDEW